MIKINDCCGICKFYIGVEEFKNNTFCAYCSKIKEEVQQEWKCEKFELDREKESCFQYVPNTKDKRWL